MIQSHKLFPTNPIASPNTIRMALAFYKSRSYPPDDQQMLGVIVMHNEDMFLNVVKHERCETHGSLSVVDINSMQDFPNCSKKQLTERLRLEIEEKIAQNIKIQQTIFRSSIKSIKPFQTARIIHPILIDFLKIPQQPTTS